MLGTQNIIINSVKPERTTQVAEGNTTLLEYGITRRDVGVIEATIPHVRHVIPLKTVAYEVCRHERRFQGKVVGTTPAFFEAVNIPIGAGRALLDKARELHSDLVVEVFEENKIGRRFYNKAGFVLLAEKVHEPTGQKLLVLKLSANEVSPDRSMRLPASSA